MVADMKTELATADIKAYRKTYYEANKEKHKAYTKAYYEANKDKCKENIRAWLDKNQDRVKKVKAEYAQKNKELIAQRHKKWRMTLKETNPEKYKDMHKTDYIKYKDKYDEWNRKASKKRVEQLPDKYIKYILLWNADKTTVVPKALIEVKRLQILINRRIKDEKCNATT